MNYSAKKIKFRIIIYWLLLLSCFLSVQILFASTNVGGRISTDTTWTLMGSPYIVTSSVSVYGTPTQTAKLTIEPGVQVKFGANYYIQISSETNKGALYAVGSAGNPIVFTSNKSTPARGDWDCIKFYDETDDALTAMAYCTVEYGGSGYSHASSIYIRKAAPTFTNCIIRYSKYDGIRCNNGSPQITGGSIVNNNINGVYSDYQALLTINGTSFSGNGSYVMSVAAEDEIISTQGISGAPTDRVQIRGGTVSRDQSWRNLGIPYSISGNIYVYKDATTAAKLTIEPGVQARFNGNYGLQISSGTYKGALYAVGTESKPIVFTSDKPTPARGDWDCIKFYDATDDALTAMAYCTVEYGGSSGYGNCSIYIQKANPQISKCTVKYSLTSGIICSSTAKPTINFCNITNNNIGIVSSGSDPQVHHCNIYGNSQYGLQNTSSNMIDARFNWWGHSSGPSGQGPGSGDAITNYIAYETWLGLLFSYPYYISEGISATKQLTTNGGLTYFFAKTDDDSNWTIIIKNASQQTVRTFTASGKRIRQTWDGKDQSSQLLPAASYSYQIQTQRQSDLSEATPLLGTIAINPEYPVGFISSPLPGDFIAGTINIIGTASDSDFKDYKLEYGKNPFPSSWVEIKQSTAPVTNGQLGVVELKNMDVPFVTFRLIVNDNSSHSTISVFTCSLSAYNLNINPNPFSPNNDGKKDVATVLAEYFTGSNWTLEIKDPSGQNVIRTYQGAGSGLSQPWDGKNESGEIQNHGFYPFVLTVSNPSMQEPNVVNSTIILDVIAPTTQITHPTEEEMVSNIYGELYLTEIFGTASDENFANYKLEYGQSYNPTTWNLIGEFSASVLNNKLGELNNSQLSNGEYTIKLTALDKADNQSSAFVHIRIGYLRLTLSAHQLNVAQSENVTVTTELPFEVTETIVIKDKNMVVKRTLVDNLPRNGGIFNDIWNGKDGNGINMPDGTYYVVVSVLAQDQIYYTLDVSNTGGVRRPPLGQDPRGSVFHLTYPSSFSPYKGGGATFTFDLDEPSLVDLYAKENIENGRARNLLKKDPLASGSHSVYWDGTDDNGAPLDKSMTGWDNFILFWVYSLSDNGIVIHGEKPEVTSMSVSTNYFCPVDKEHPDGLEISYTISKASNVVLIFQNSQGVIVKTMDLGTQNSGSHSLHWDGRTDNGELADSSAYRIGIELSDSVGNKSLIRFCLIVLYY